MSIVMPFFMHKPQIFPIFSSSIHCVRCMPSSQSITNWRDNLQHSLYSVTLFMLYMLVCVKFTRWNPEKWFTIVKLSVYIVSILYGVSIWIEYPYPYAIDIRFQTIQQMAVNFFIVAWNVSPIKKNLHTHTHTCHK